MIPSFFESFAAVNTDVEDEDGATGFSGEHDGAGLGDVTRSARTVDCESTVDAFFEATSHHCEAT